MAGHERNEVRGDTSVLGFGLQCNAQDAPQGRTAKWFSATGPRRKRRRPRWRFVIPSDTGAVGLERENQEYVAKAKEIAGDDPDLQFDFGVFCKASGGATNADRATIGVPNSLPHLTPYPSPSPAVPLGLQRLFDNFYWIGDTGVGSWLITSDDGYILFDTLNNAEEARDVLVEV